MKGKHAADMKAMLLRPDTGRALDKILLVLIIATVIV